MSGGVLLKREWAVRQCPIPVARRIVEQEHYAAGASNTATYLHGIYKNGEFLLHEHSDDGCLGVAWWIPPTKSAAQAWAGSEWRGVLALSRLAIRPEVPKNGASFLLSRSVRLIDRERWPVLVTYADTWRGHTGQIYKACNWDFCGQTTPEPVYTINGRMVSRKAGPKTRTKKEMLELGAICQGRFSKYRYRAPPIKQEEQ